VFEKVLGCVNMIKISLNYVKCLIIIISQMGVFGGYDHKYVVNKHFDKLSLLNGR
jgi:hypothetical protein